jgi:hypothetical protein
MVKELTSNVDFYFTLLDHIQNNRNPIKEMGIYKQQLYYYRRKLVELGFLKKDKNLWIVLKGKKIDLEHAMNWRDKKIRGHAFIWKVKQDRHYDWKMLLEKNNIPYKLVRGLIPRIFIKDKKVWLGKETITIYDSKSFYGKNAIESRKYAVYELMSIMNELQRKLGITFKYLFKPTREHYGLIKNELARQCNKNKEKIIVRDNLDGEWLWVDDSEGMLGELETGGKGITKDRTLINQEVQNWFNDMKKTNFKITPSFIMNKLSESNEILKETAERINQSSKTSLDTSMVIKQQQDNIIQMQSEVRGLTELVSQLAFIIKNMKDK